jgi:16S rRNA (cytidine1402-2'-O)-methyltransferase
MKGTLYLIPCPLGDMKDLEHIGPHIMQKVQSLQYFVVERSKTAREFIKACGHPLAQQDLTIMEWDKHQPDLKLRDFIQPLLEGHCVGLISEAGAPGIADPGASLVALAHQRDIKVQPLTGPSAIFLALMASGLNGQQFKFNGYPPIDKADLKHYLHQLERESSIQHCTQLFIETPYRNEKFLDALLLHLSSSTLLCVARSLTTEEEFIHTASVKAWQSMERPSLHKKPSIFLFLSASR